MDLHCLFEIYAQRQRSIKALFNRAREYFNADSIHDLRVEIKRLRALFNLIEWINPAFQAKSEMKDIRKLFKAAAIIRDNHVQQELAAAWMDRRQFELSEYLNELKRVERDSRRGFAKACRSFDAGKFTDKWRNIRSTLAALPPEKFRLKSEERLRFLIDGLISFRSKSDFVDKDYHEIRILSKETRYTLEIIRKCFRREQSMQDFDEAIRKMHQALGKWHDDDTGLRFLDSFLLDYEGEPLFRRGDYFKLIRGLEREKRKLLSDFEKAWKTFLQIAVKHGLVEEGPPAGSNQGSIGDNNA
jgi:CHAD domain-containing protein